MYGSFDTMSERKLIRILKHWVILDINILIYTKSNRKFYNYFGALPWWVVFSLVVTVKQGV